MKKMSLFTTVVLSSLAVASVSCKKKKRDEAPAPQSTQAPTAQDSGTANSDAGSKDKNAPNAPKTDVSSSTEQVKIVKSTRLVTLSTSNGYINESHALFAIVPSVSGLEIMDVTVDGKALSTSTSGFKNAKIRKGKISESEVKNMQLDAEKRSYLLSEYKDALFVYSEDHSFDFQEDGKTIVVKITYGKDSKKLGEFESVFNNN